MHGKQLQDFNAWRWEWYKKVHFRITLHATRGLEWEIALTYISSVSRRSVASASPRVCGHCHGAPSGPRDWCHLVDLHQPRWRRWGPPVSLWISWWQSVDVVSRDELNPGISSEAPGGRDLSAPYGSPSRSCRGCVAGDWRVLWSSFSGPSGGTRVSGSSLRPVFWSNLTRGKTERPVSFTVLVPLDLFSLIKNVFDFLYLLSQP